MKNPRFLMAGAVALGLTAVAVLLFRSPHLAPAIGALGAVTGAVAAVAAVLLSLPSRQSSTLLPGGGEKPSPAPGDVREGDG